jgi:hypothetical protein
MAKTDLLAIVSPGSRALRNTKYEKYCRLRASAQPRIPAYREAGWETSDDDDAYSNACRLERRPGVRKRIEYLSHQDEELIAEKRRRIEERLWAIHEANVKSFFETYEQQTINKNSQLNTDENGRIQTERRERPRLISDLPDEIAQLIEDVTIDNKGRLIPRLYSKLQASKELRAMLNIGRPEQATDVSRLSDAELIQQLTDQAKELGIEIDLNYRFAQPPKPDDNRP